MRLTVSVTRGTGNVLSFDETYVQAFRCYERLSGLDATLDRPVSDLIGATPEFEKFKSYLKKTKLLYITFYSKRAVLFLHLIEHD